MQCHQSLQSVKYNRSIPVEEINWIAKLSTVTNKLHYWPNNTLKFIQQTSIIVYTKICNDFHIKYKSLLKINYKNYFLKHRIFIKRYYQITQSTFKFYMLYIMGL